MERYYPKKQLIDVNDVYSLFDKSGFARLHVADIDTIPRMDVEPVKYGRWIASHDEFCACSICKYPVYVGWNQTNYCPNCGAKMDGGAD